MGRLKPILVSLSDDILLLVAWVFRVIMELNGDGKARRRLNRKQLSRVN